MRNAPRAAAILAGVPMAAYALLLVRLPPIPMSFDEAKYVAIGRNVLAGLGPRTDFGELFIAHSPLWPLVLAVPHAALGVDPLVWGRAVNAIAAVAVLGLTARLGWRIHPAAAILASWALAAWPMLLDLSRTARLDVPQAAVCLLYLEMAWIALERRSVPRAIVAGLVLGVAFLIKESSLVLAPAPFLAAAVAGIPMRRVSRVAGVALLVWAGVSSWWFAWVDALSHRVYALGLPGGWLLPLAVAVVAAAIALIVAPGSRPVRDAAARAQARARFGRSEFTTRLLLALGFAAIWVTVLGLGFSRSAVLDTEPLLNPGQLARYARTWVGDLAAPAAFGLGGVVAVWLLWRRDPRFALALAGLACSVSWALLVAATDEPPRDLVVQIALLEVAAAGGWVVATQQVVVRFESADSAARAASASPAPGTAPARAAGTPAAPSVAPRDAATAGRTDAPGFLPGRVVAAVAVLLVAALGVGGLTALGIDRYAKTLKTDPEAVARLAATATIDTWLAANVPTGSVVAFGAVQGEESAVALDGRYRLVLLAPELASFDATAPEGIATADGEPIDDLVAVDRHPRENGFYALSAASVRRALVGDHASHIVYVSGLPTAAPSVVGLLDTTPGIARTAEWQWPYASGLLTVDVYSVTPSQVAVPTTRVFLPAPALQLIVQRAKASPDGPALARELLGRVALSPPSTADPAALAALKALASN